MHELLCVVGDSFFLFCFNVSHQREMNKIIHTLTHKTCMLLSIAMNVLNRRRKCILLANYGLVCSISFNNLLLRFQDDQYCSCVLTMMIAAN